MRRLIPFLLLCACAAPQAVEAPLSPVTRDLTGKALGTGWHVRWVESGEGDRTADVQRVTEAALAEVDAHMSTWRDDSELSLARAADGPVTISQDTALVVDAALDLARQTGGAFDPTVQPLMELWGFHGTRRDDIPGEEEIAAALQDVGYQAVRLELGPRPTLDTAGRALDLSAIAKGHAVDRIHHGLAELGLGSVFVEVGGEVRVSGPGASGGLWRVGVELPRQGTAQGQELALVGQVTNVSVATSGNYRNVYEVDGRRLVHTMDPRAGRPVETPVASATVLAPDCRTADGLATALMVLPADEGLALVESMPDVDAALLLFDGEGFRVRATPGAAARLQTVHDAVK